MNVMPFLEIRPRDQHIIKFSIVYICTKSFRFHCSRSLCSIFDIPLRWSAQYLNLGGSWFEGRAGGNGIVNWTMISISVPISRNERRQCVVSAIRRNEYLNAGDTMWIKKSRIRIDNTSGRFSESRHGMRECEIQGGPEVRAVKAKLTNMRYFLNFFFG
jgi:hypothetical protein